MKQIFAIAAIIGVALTFSLAGCGKDSLSSKAGSLTLNIKAMSGNPGLPGVSGRAGLSKSVLRFSASTASAQAQQVTITTAKVVLGEIEIESSSGDSMDFKSKNAVVVNLDLTGGLTNLGTVSIPFGTYSALELQIKKLTLMDSVVYRANPDLQERSIFVRGYVNGDTSAVFTFKSALEAEQEQSFSPPLVVNESSPTVNLTLSIDIRTWFNDRSGNFLDPRISQNQNAIERNIKASINAFEDDNEDGEPDDDSDGDDDEPDDDGEDDDGEDDDSESDN